LQKRNKKLLIIWLGRWIGVGGYPSTPDGISGIAA
jgi:hypothetical protein